MFEILKPLDVQLISLTNRSEKHGEDDVPAISMWFEVETAASILDMLGDGQLRHAVYYGDEKQTEVAGVPKTTPHLRSKSISRVQVDQPALEGWSLKVDHGIDEHDPVKFGGCKVDGFSFQPKGYEVVMLKFRVGTSDINADSLGIVGMKVGQRVTIAALTAPKVKDKDKPTDKGAPLFEGGEKLAEPRTPGAAERAAVDKVKGVDASTKKPHKEAKPKKTTPTVDKAKLPLKSTPVPAPVRTTRGATKTKRELAAGLRAAAATDAFAKAHGKGKK